MNLNGVKREISEVAGYLWKNGWCERNGGNISVLLEDAVAGSASDPFVPMAVPKEAAELAFYTTQTGGRLREIQSNPNSVCAVVQFNDEATGYYVRETDLTDFKATSEFIMHVLVHLDILASGSKKRCLVHCHPNELIALSHHPDLGQDEDGFNFSCMSMLPEVRGFVPRGMALVPYALSGSRELADLTAQGFRTRDVVIWSKHGACSCGQTLMEAFDYIDVANKGAEIYLKCLAAGYKPVGLSEAEMDELEEAFDLPPFRK